MRRYSPRIDQHSRTLYRLGRALGKPMTKVADDLIKHGLDNIEQVYGQELADHWRQTAMVAEDLPPPRR